MNLEILIVTMPSRYVFLGQLLSLLEPQIVGKFGDVDIRISGDDLDLPVGERRERLRQRAKGDYICYCDDDDLVSPDYVSSIVPMLDGVDYIGFEVQTYINRMPQKPTYHDLAYNGWSEDQNAYYRDISHLNPMRREVALQRPMEGGVGEDSRWASAMRGIPKTSYYIPNILYHYIVREPKDDANDPHTPFRLALLERLRCGR